MVQRRKKYSDGNNMKQFYYVQVSPLTGGAPTPNRRHCADNERVRYSITSGFIITWIGILILQGAHFGSDKRTLLKMWQKTPYGLSLPCVWNSLSCDAYEFLQRNLYFADTYKQQPENSEGYDPLFKVRYPLDMIGKGLRKVWTRGNTLQLTNQ